MTDEEKKNRRQIINLATSLALQETERTGEVQKNVYIGGLKMELIVLSKEESIKDSLTKLVEETIEVCNEVNDENKENITSEVLDVIQVCIGMLDKLEQEGINLRKAIEKHNLKLLNRGWRYKNVIHIDIE